MRIAKNFLLAALIAAPLPVHAQSPTPVCWLRSGPADRCGSFLVTEAAVEIPLFTTDRPISAGSREDDFMDARFLLSGGLMKNYSATRAAGVVVGFDVNRGWNQPTRVEARHRWWKPNSTALDLSGGFTHMGLPNGHAYGITTAIGGEWRYIGADARVDLMRGPDRNVVGGFVGARATSAGAPVATLIAIGVLFAVIARTSS